jgi:protein subunit release factor A
MRVSSSNYDVAYKEATSVYNDVTGKGIDVDDLYTDLMKKEKNVLNTINKLVDEKENPKYRGVLKQTIPELAKNTVDTLMKLVVDIGNLAENESDNGIIEIITDVMGKQDRIFYVGIAIVFIAIAIMLVTMSDN